MIKELIRKNCTHYDEREPGTKVEFLIIHYTGTKSAQDADDIFMGVDTETNPAGRVSSHYMIDEKGCVTQYVDENLRAWHAGKSYWRGIHNLNSHSIGIELANPGHEFGYTKFPDEQIDALISLSRQIMTSYFIPAHKILGHSDIAPDRKIDPGEFFPWEYLASKSVGLWPDVTDEDIVKGKTLIKNDEQLHRHLTELGYNPLFDTKTLIRAFQRHYQPEAFKKNGKLRKANKMTAAKLIAISRKVNTIAV